MVNYSTKPKPLVGQIITRFWYGEKFKFRRTESGNWEIIEGNPQMIPAQMIEELPE